MKQFGLFANPLFLLVLIGSFVYVYFFYLADVQRGGGDMAEPETELTQPPGSRVANTTTIPVAGMVMKEEISYGYAGRAVVPVAGGALGKTWIEAHWIGLEVGPLSAAVAKANNIPSTITGVLVDEVTLVSADAGLLAGDIITAINGTPLSDLKSFKEATRQVAQANQADVSIYRNGAHKTIRVTTTDVLGLAQEEGAPMILATDRPPHGYYGPCDKCHSIAPGGTNLNQMAKDMGDVLSRTAPNIKLGTPPPHRDRGTCTHCHVLL